MWLSFLVVVLCAGERSWLEVAQLLARDTKVVGIARDWEGEFSRLMAGAGLSVVGRSRRVLVPFSGGDVLTALAVGPMATEYVLVDHSPALGPSGEARRWNASEIEGAASAAAAIVETSHGGAYQLGLLVRRFARRYGMVALLIAILASAAVEVLDVVTDAIIKCRRPTGSTFSIRYVAGDLHDEATVAALEASLAHNETLTLLKGTELGLRRRVSTREDFKGIANVDDILAAQRRRNEAVARLSDAILRVSRIIVQDYTGVPFRALETWAWRIVPFGVYNISNRDADPDSNAMSRFFQTRVPRDLGALRFGYCLAVTSKSSNRRLTVLSHRRASPSASPLALQQQRHRSGERRGACHMLVALSAPC